jgi:hypothetical protein
MDKRQFPKAVKPQDQISVLQTSGGSNAEVCRFLLTGRTSLVCEFFGKALGKR